MAGAAERPHLAFIEPLTWLLENSMERVSLLEGRRAAMILGACMGIELPGLGPPLLALMRGLHVPASNKGRASLQLALEVLDRHVDFVCQKLPDATAPALFFVLRAMAIVHAPKPLPGCQGVRFIDRAFTPGSALLRECGRDAVRLLHNVACVPGVVDAWRRGLGCVTEGAFGCNVPAFFFVFFSFPFSHSLLLCLLIK